MHKPVHTVLHLTSIVYDIEVNIAASLWTYVRHVLLEIVVVRLYDVFIGTSAGLAGVVEQAEQAKRPLANQLQHRRVVLIVNLTPLDAFA